MFLYYNRKAVGPGDEITETVTMAAKRSGFKEIVASISSDQLAGMNGSAVVRIKYME